MSKTLAQIFATNPASTILNNDLFYLVQSPYTPGTDAAITGATLKSLFLLSANNLSDLTNPAAARSNLGLTAIASASPPLSGTLGGTGVNNGLSTITIGGNVTFSGAFPFTGTLTGITTVTFPTSGTLATTSQLPTPSALTKVDDTNVTLTLGGTPATALLQAVSLTVGWSGTLSGTRGGTGINNGANTATYAGNLNFASSFTTSGAFAVTQTYTGITNVTFPTSGTLATTSQLPTFPITLAQGGTNASLVASNGGIFYSTATAGAILSGTATARQMLQSGASAAPAWSTSTWPATTTANAVLFSSATNTVGEIASAASSVLITSAGSVPSFSQTLPSAVQTNITALGAQSQALNMNTHQINNLSAGVAATDAANVGQLTAASSPLTTKGDLYTFTTVNARLPVGTINGQILQVNSGAATGLAWSTSTFPVTGGTSGNVLISDGTNYIASTSLWPNTVGASGKVVISNGTTNVYSTPTYPNASVTAGKFIISDGTNYIASTSIMPNTVGAVGTLIRSDGTVNAYTTTTYPNTNAINTLLYASAANVMSALATANSSVLVTDSSGVPSLSSTLPAFTTSSITFSPTTGGIVGTTTNDNTAAGKVGELVSSAIAVASAVSLVNNTNKDVTSISLTAGDWDVFGNVFITLSIGCGSMSSWSSTTSVTKPDVSLITQISFATGTCGSTGMVVPGSRLSLSGTTTVYLSCVCNFASGTATACGGIYARRRR